MNPPKFTLEEIKATTNESTFEKAVNLYESGKVTQVEEDEGSYTAVVIGTKPYRVFIEARQYDYGDCTCYLGQNDILCKHIVALAIYVVKDGKPLTAEDKKLVQAPTCSGKLGKLTEKELSATKKAINQALRYIKPYNGPSRLWFSYQKSLSEGCNRLSMIISDLPVSIKTTELLIDLLLRLDKKLAIGGVDDSDGRVARFVEDVVVVLQEHIKLDFSCIKAFKKLKNKETSFGWEEPLLDEINK